jgi:adenylate kinase
MRDPVEEYKIIKEVEDMVLNFKKENVKTYVVSAGILYGKGEAIFNSHIQKAWLQDPVRLPYVGDGNNRLPTIHVTDLARMVKTIYEKKPNQKYIFAIDNNKKPRQKKLVSSISNGIGTGLVESIDIPEKFKRAHPKMTPIQLDLDWKKSLLLDLYVNPSALFIKQDAPPAAEGGEEAEEGAGDELLEMNWHCKSGMSENIQLVKQEFAKERNLKPVKIFISGPPCSGKTFFGKQMAEHYNVPHINMERLLADLASWDQEKEDNYNKREATRKIKIEEIKA